MIAKWIVRALDENQGDPIALFIERFNQKSYALPGNMACQTFDDIEIKLHDLSNPFEAASATKVVLNDMMDQQLKLSLTGDQESLCLLCFNWVNDTPVVENLISDALMLFNQSRFRFTVKPHIVTGNGRFIVPLGDNEDLNNPERYALSLLEEGRLRLFQQPIMNYGSDGANHFELLARFVDDNGKLISAGDILQGCESARVYRALDHAVLERLDQSALDFDTAISINVDRHSLLEGEWLRKLEGILRRSPKLKGSLNLEITERGTNGQIAETLQTLGVLKHWGLGLAIDDLGCGIASVNELVTSPFDALKIDRMVMHAAQENPAAGSMLGALVGFAKRWKFGAIAEGIESASAFTYAESLGFDQFQGHYFGNVDRPMI